MLINEYSLALGPLYFQTIWDERLVCSHGRILLQNACFFYSSLKWIWIMSERRRVIEWVKSDLSPCLHHSLLTPLRFQPAREKRSFLAFSLGGATQSQFTWLLILFTGHTEYCHSSCPVFISFKATFLLLRLQEHIVKAVVNDNGWYHRNNIISIITTIHKILVAIW